MNGNKRITVAEEVREVFRREPDVRYNPDACADRVRQQREARGETEPAKIEAILRAFYRNRRRR